MVIAVTKATLVILFFMHLRYDKLFHTVVFVSAILAASLFVGFTLMDSGQYQHTNIWHPTPAGGAVRPAPDQRLGSSQAREQLAGSRAARTQAYGGRSWNRLHWILAASVLWSPDACVRVLGYLMITIDRSRANSQSKDDTQVGIKIVLYGIILAGVCWRRAVSTSSPTYVFAGFKGGRADQVALPPIVVGALTSCVAKVLLPRTNAANHQPRALERSARWAQLGVVQRVRHSGLPRRASSSTCPWAGTRGLRARSRARGLFIRALARWSLGLGRAGSAGRPRRSTRAASPRRWRLSSARRRLSSARWRLSSARWRLSTARRRWLSSARRRWLSSARRRCTRRKVGYGR